jgi:hypothetical protein
MRSVKTILNPFGTVMDSLGIGKEKREEAYERGHGETFSLQEIALISRYAAADRLLGSIGRRPSKGRGADWTWSGDYWAVPAYIQTEYERRSKDPANAGFDFKANCFFQEASLL